MSDFDVVLERLLADPGFAAALSADPAHALAGYRLDADELALLQLQLGTDAGGQHGVESRANQSSLFGMFAPLAGLAGLGDEIGRSIGSATDAAIADADGGPPGAVTDSQAGLAGVLARVETGFGPADPGSGSAAETGFGSADPRSGSGSGSAETGFGSAEPGSGSAETGFGSRETGFGPAEPPPDVEPVVPDDYRTRVDTDGDGNWDRHLVRGRADGGVDILVDADRDGRTDFVGHDLDADGLVDISEYDRNRDGFFEKRMYDDDGDGWMDRTVQVKPSTDPAY